MATDSLWSASRYGATGRSLPFTGEAVAVEERTAVITEHEADKRRDGVRVALGLQPPVGKLRVQVAQLAQQLLTAAGPVRRQGERLLSDRDPGDRRDDSTLAPVSGVSQVIEQVRQEVPPRRELGVAQRVRPGRQGPGASIPPLPWIARKRHAAGNHAVHDWAPSRQILGQVVGQRQLIMDKQFDWPAAKVPGVTVRGLQFAPGEQHHDVEIRPSGPLGGSHATGEQGPHCLGEQLGNHIACVGNGIAIHTLSVSDASQASIRICPKPPFRVSAVP